MNILTASTSDDADPTTLAWLYAKLANYTTWARRMFAESGELVSSATVCMQKDPETGQRYPTIMLAMLLADFRSPADAGMFAGVVREHALRSDAVAVLFMSEVWTASGPRSGPRVRPEHAPDRNEAVMVTYDHVALPGPRMQRAIITRVGDAATLGPFEEDPNGTILKDRSRLGGMLPDVLRTSAKRALS